MKKETIGVIVILQLAIISPFIPTSGADWITAYREATLTGLYGVDTWNPYPAYWLFGAFAWMPAKVGLMFWNLFNAAGFIYAAKKLNGRYLPFALSLPCLWTFYTGQIEGVIALGLAAAFTAPPIIAGFGIVLLSFKPQIGALVIPFILWQRKEWRLLVLPIIIYAASLLQWGWWVPEWVASITSNNTQGYATNTSLWTLFR